MKKFESHPFYWKFWKLNPIHFIKWERVSNYDEWFIYTILSEFSSLLIFLSLLTPTFLL